MEGKPFYHNTFRKYLLERFDGDVDEVARVLETAEHLIPRVLCEVNFRKEDEQ